MLKTNKWLIFLVVVTAVLAADLLTKHWALQQLDYGAPTTYAAGVLPLTLHFNTGGLWGIGSGLAVRWFFPVATAIAMIVLLRLFQQTGRRETLRLIAIPMIAGGALGNLYDRVRWDKGVVDFLGPFDLGFMVWPIFNVADMAISCCTLLLVVSLWRADARAAAEAREAAKLEAAAGAVEATDVQVVSDTAGDPTDPSARLETTRS